MNEFERQRGEISKLNTQRERRWKTEQVDYKTDLKLSDEIVRPLISPWI